MFLANQNIRMISEGSCDIEDWSNDAENSALYHHRNKLQVKFKKNCTDTHHCAKGKHITQTFYMH